MQILYESKWQSKCTSRVHNHPLERRQWATWVKDNELLNSCIVGQSGEELEEKITLSKMRIRTSLSCKTVFGLKHLQNGRELVSIQDSEQKNNVEDT